MVSLSVLCQKDVISIVTGQNIGRVDDIEFCSEDALVRYLVIFGRPRLFGIFGRSEDVKIPWENVVKIGQDAILVNKCETEKNFRSRKFSIKFD